MVHGDLSPCLHSVFGKPSAPESKLNNTVKRWYDAQMIGQYCSGTLPSDESHAGTSLGVDQQELLW
jgi:hypothetical protein